ncbi:MAG: RecQ family ATP-dependent DNA helicase [Treponema sp.]|jgi:ATP-dependent DNA helicase RecQ|nr:RecQ family ATP-dependent DNA helicase [Treponema sp.]
MQNQDALSRYALAETDPLNAAAQALFGVSYLFPYQRLVITNILEAAEAAGIPIHWPTTGGSAAADLGAGAATEVEADRESRDRQIVILPTGAGKSLCFQLPAMLLAGPTLVIYPILSLMADQERRLQERGFMPVILRGGQSPEERSALWERIHSGKGRFIIANPEVLLTASVLGRLKEFGIVHIVIDEAHCVSEWGEQFRPRYRDIARIVAAAGGPAGRVPVVTAFTATASPPVLEKIEQLVFGGSGAHRIIGNPDRSNISYAAQGCILRDLAVRDLLIKHPKPAIVFCSSRKGTEKLARYLIHELGGQGPQTIRFYHAGLSREEKTAGERWFLTHPQGILIATCAYGMGVDKTDIRTVIHRDCPPSVEAYLQESGRVGRDGLPARAILLWGPDDERSMKRVCSAANRIRLSQLLSYARAPRGCRREALLRLLTYEGTGETPGLDCCDVCAGTAVPTLREEASLLGFFKNNRRRYTLAEVARVLAQTEPLRWSEEEARQAVSQLISDHTLRQIKNPLWKHKIDLDLRLPRAVPAGS